MGTSNDHYWEAEGLIREAQQADPGTVLQANLTQQALVHAVLSVAGLGSEDGLRVTNGNGHGPVLVEIYEDR